jgi:hypothetical protein
MPARRAVGGELELQEVDDNELHERLGGRLLAPAHVL